MSFSESKELLQKSLQDKRLLEDQSGTDMLLTLLVNLPLAIMQAAAYLKYRESSKNEIMLLQMDFKGKWRYQEMNNAVATTWIISFKQIQRQDRLAADYMRFIACIKEQDIPFGPTARIDFATEKQRPRHSEGIWISPRTGRREILQNASTGSFSNPELD
jgi:hypothetical protein